MFTQVFKNIFDDELFAKVAEHQKQLDQLSDNAIKAMKYLAAHGWYVSGRSKIYDIIRLTQDIQKGYLRKVDNTMKSYYDSEFRAIMYNLNNLYPERKKIFMQAAKAHRQQMYFASIALFLSQADGICKGHLFILKNEKKNLKKEINRFNNTILAEFLEVIMDVSAIDAPYSDGFKYPSKLNRHAVFHGLDITYGTNINSLKALSLLTFVGEFFNKYKKRIA